MKKRLLAFLLMFGLLLQLFPIEKRYAEAAVVSPDFGWSLGKYNPVTDKYHVGASKAWWNDRRYWTDGPWSIYLNDVRPENYVGSVINFSDVLLTTDNGYPLVESTQWDQWINVFGGDKGFVLGQLNSAYLNNKWEIDTLGSGKKFFANLAKIAELSGGKGGNFDNKQMYSIYHKTPNPTSSLTANKTYIKTDDTVTFTIKANTQNYYYQFFYVSFAGAGKTFINNQRYDGSSITLTQTVTFPDPGTYTFSLLVKDGVMRDAPNQTVIITVGDQPPPVQKTPPVADFSMPASAIEGETVNLVDQSSDSDGYITNWAWNAPAGSTNSLGNSGGTISFSGPGTYQVTLTVTDNDGLTATCTKSIAVTAQPPKAQFDLPAQDYVDHPVAVNEYSTDPDGWIDSWLWIPDPNTNVTHNLKQGGGTITFGATGTYNLTLEVTDNHGYVDRLTKSIYIRDATPIADIWVRGTRKENRKVIIDSSGSESPSFYPIDHSRDEWVIEPLIGGTACDIKLGTRSGATQEVLFKKEGTYRVKLRVYNTKGASAWVSQDVIIAPDLPPITNYTMSTVAYRNPRDSNYVNINLTDQSYSNDADYIQQRVWKYWFDANNNGTFSDDPVQVLDSGNNTNPTLKVNKVGKYLIELDAIEGFGQETIPWLVSSSDYRTGNTKLKLIAEKVVEVKNIAPNTSVGSTVKPKVDIVLVHGNLADYNTRFPSLVANLEPVIGSKLKAKGIDYAFYNTTSQYSGLNTYTVLNNDYARWYIGDGAFDSDPLPWWVRDRIVDFGRVIDRDTISSSWVNLSIWPGTYNLEVSLDGVNWHYVTRWYRGDTGIYFSDNLNVDKSLFPIPKFRYAKLYPTSRHESDMAIMKWQFSVRIDDSSKSYLKPIQDEAAKQYRVGAAKYLVNFTEELYRDTGTYSTSGTGTAVNNAGAHLVILNNSTSRPHTQPLFDSTWKKALYTTTWDMSLPLDQLADYIIAQTPMNFTNETKYLLLGDAQLNFNPSYSDYENDPKIAENWLITHDPDYLDNNSGYVWFHNTSLSAPVTSFDKVGKYDIAFKAQDDPTGGNNLFNNYRLWSNSVPATVIVHRKPIANFSYNLVQGKSLTFTNTAYDPDFQNRRTDKGVIESVWQWRLSTSGTWNTGLPSTWPVAGDYVIRLTVKDIYGVWSDPYEKTISLTVPITNKPPVPDFTWSDPVYNNTKVQFTNHSQDPDGDNLTYTWYKRPVGGAWTQFSTAVNPSYVIGPQGTYEIGLVVNDGTETVVKIKTLVLQNRAPNANFTWAPNPAFEGDSVNLTGSTTDPDGDTITSNWSVRTPSGTIKAYNTANVNLGVVQAGTYQVSLTVTDSFGAPNTITKNVLIGSLGITGYIRHTPQWEQNRIKYNQSKTGTDDSPRPYNYFFAGETFVLRADTTDTGMSTTKANSVRVDLVVKNESELLNANTARTYWSGEMFRDYFEQLSDADYTFRFTATYSNGVVKTHDVTITIRNSWREYYQFHRAL